VINKNCLIQMIRSRLRFLILSKKQLKMLKVVWFIQSEVNQEHQLF